jgi:hypothetical protein
LCNKIVFSAEVSIFDRDGFIREIHEDTDYPTITGLIPNQSLNMTVIVNTILPDEANPELEIDRIKLIMQEPIVVNYQDAVFTESDDSADVY